MAIDPWAIDASAGSPGYSGQELRLATIAPFLAGTGASLGVRSGVRPSGSGTDLLVQAQGTPNMTVKVNIGVAVVQGSISATQGPYSWALDAATNLTIAAAHATLDRTDLIVVRVRDAGVDTSGQRDGNVVVITGTAGAGVPALPTDATYMTIAQISVVHAVTSITSGAITDKRTFIAATGGIIPCTSATEPAANTLPPGQVIYRVDLDIYKRSDGSAYLVTAAPGTWTDFSSSFALTSDAVSPTKGNSTVDSKYQQIGKTVNFFVRFAIGSTFSAGSGTYRWGLPVVASTASTDGVVAPTFVNDSGTAVRNGIGLLTAGWAILYYANPTQTALTSAGPGTAWAVGDYVQTSFTYEAA